MRILIAHSFHRVEGGENRYVSQQVTLLRNNHDVDLLAAENRTLPTSSGTALQMTWSSRIVADVQARLSQFDPHVVHVHNTYPYFGPAVHVAAKRLSIPLVMTVHNFRLRCPNGLTFTEGAKCERCVRGNYLNAIRHHCFPTQAQATAYATTLWLHRFLLRIEDKVGRFITPSAYMAGQLRSWGIEESRIATVPNFTTLLPPASSSVSRERRGIFIGRLSPEKGLDVLLDSLQRAGDPPFILVGSGPSTAALMAHAARAGLTRTRFLGEKTVEEVRTLLRFSSFAVFPSKSDENAPLAVIESMMAGCAPIVSDRGGLPELVRTRGLVCASGDAAAFAACIRKLIDKPSLSQELGGKALEYARQELSPQRHATRLEAVYGSLT